MKKNKADRRLKISVLVRETEMLKAQVIQLRQKVDKKIQELEAKKSRVHFERVAFLKRIKILENDIADYKELIAGLKLGNLMEVVDEIIRTSHRSAPIDVRGCGISFKEAKACGQLESPYHYMYSAYRSGGVWKKGTCRCSPSGQIIWVVPSDPPDENETVLLNSIPVVCAPDLVTT